MSPVLLETLRGIHLQDGIVYWVKRESSYRGRRVRHYGWGSERIRRFYNRSVTAFSHTRVHEDLIVEGLEKLGVGPGMIRLHLVCERLNGPHAFGGRREHPDTFVLRSPCIR